ncbi:MAG: hypothetical protein IPJ26_11025 [Bacteroidetes bacterium]|nr:hypothetical protein [Bacteroidota bacterium]
MNGCNGPATWYKLCGEGPIVVGQGHVVDVMPTRVLVTLVVCCDPLYPACCDTDTVCVYVNPHPILQWNTNYPSVCQNSAPIVLDSNNILVYVNNNWVSIKFWWKWSLLWTICGWKYLYAIYHRYAYYLLHLYR